MLFKRIIKYKSPFIANYNIKDVSALAKGQGSSEKNTPWGLFVRSMIVTVSAIMLVLIGYFTARYLSGGL